MWAITNLTSGGSIPQVAHCLEQGCLQPLCSLLNAKDTKIILVLLDALGNVLSVCMLLCFYKSQICSVYLSKCSKISTIKFLYKKKARFFVKDP